jgi:hypothetical protein
MQIQRCKLQESRLEVRLQKAKEAAAAAADSRMVKEERLQSLQQEQQHAM